MSYEFVERDLAHIRAIVMHMEHSSASALAAQAATGISLDYWRTRIGAVLAIPSLPIPLRKQSKELLGRLDRLNNEQPRDKTSR